MLEFDDFRRRVLSAVETGIGEGPPVSFDDENSTWSREALRVTLIAGGDGTTAVASRTAADLFGVGNTLAMRQELSEDGATECASVVLGWLNNPKLYVKPKTAASERAKNPTA